MDPNETLALFLDAVDARDTDAMREHAENLAAWIDRGGFTPSSPNRPVGPMSVERFMVARLSDSNGNESGDYSIIDTETGTVTRHGFPYATLEASYARQIARRLNAQES